MTSRLVLCFIAAMLAIHAGGKTHRHKTKKKSPDFILVEAYSQKMSGGARNSMPRNTGEHFVIIWKSATAPETFFWRGDNGFLMCTMEKAHKIAAANMGKYPKGMSYTVQQVMPNEIRPGDTVQLAPVTGGKYPVPAEVTPAIKNTLFYKTSGDKWLSFPVKNIIHKNDIQLP